MPVFYWPFAKFDSEFDPILRNFRFQTGNVFGQQVQFDFSGFRVLNFKKPLWIDTWNLDVDYLSYRGLGLGSEIGWFGKDPVGDIMDPYKKDKKPRDIDRQYFGYLDFWGLQDMGRDVLGPGPAIMTNGPPGAGKKGYQRTSDPAFQDFRGSVRLRHMQRLIGDDAPDDEDFRYQIEGAYISDRNFLEEYYKRRLRHRAGPGDAALRHLPEAEPRPDPPDRGQPPELVHRHPVAPEAGIHRLGDSFLNNWLNVSMRAGRRLRQHAHGQRSQQPEHLRLHPRDPVSNTSGTLEHRPGLHGRRDRHAAEHRPEFEFLKFVPYVQGQVVGWDNQIGDEAVGRAWGASGPGPTSWPGGPSPARSSRASC